MRILEIRWKNFNSYGNIEQTLNFDTKEGNLFLLHSASGMGKSTIAEVIVYSIYGKVEKKNKPDLPNRINKNLECSIKLLSKNKIVEIERGISPTFLKVKINGTEYDTAGNNNIQEYLDKEIFDIPYHVFKNIVVLSINDFRSFLTMTPGDKRNIIDRLFGFSVINEMKDKIKNERKDIKEKLKTIQDELNIIDSTILSIEDRMKKLEKFKEEDKNKIINDYKDKIKQLLENKKSVDEEYERLQLLEARVSSLLEEKKQEFTNNSHDLRSTKEKIKLYENDVCPSCGAPLTTDDHIHTKTVLEETVETKESIIHELKTDIKELDRKVKAVSEKVKEQYSNSTKSSVLINQYKAEVEKIVTEEKEIDKNTLTDLLEENKDKIEERKVKQAENTSEDSFLEILEFILGDDGVKNLAMKTILPTLNQNINNMINQVHLPYTIKFNDKFDCVITSIGEQINPLSMSTGERKRADFIIIIALLKILKIQYPTLNLLFLDEIFSSVDAAGVYEIIKILQEVTKENGLNTWVINHSELPMELFDHRVEIAKVGGFSQLVKESIV